MFNLILKEMIKKVIFSMAAVALLTFSCTRSEVENFNITTPNAISLNPNTASTRAAIMDLDSLKLDVYGFVVYADTVGTAISDDWFIDRANHVFGTDGWGFYPSILWPNTGYPLVFLAYYPDDSNSGVITGVTTPALPFTSSSLELAISIPPEKGLQEDILVARDTQLIEKPSNGQLQIDFKHILSKVNFTVSTSDGTSLITDPDHKAYILAVGFSNLFSTNTFEAVDDTWGPLAPGDPTADYNYHNAFVGLTGADIYDEIEFVNADKNPFFTGAAADTSHLMLLPQDPIKWVVTGTIAAPTNEAHIKMLYRLQVSGNDDFIGYLHADDHDDYSTTPSIAGYTDQLYVLVGFSYAGTWESGKGYSYDIPLPGKGGGIYLDVNYYDNQGNKTDLVIPGAVIGGHVLGIDHITLDPDITNWNNQTSTEVED